VYYCSDTVRPWAEIVKRGALYCASAGPLFPAST
jgi:hypothetical protein